MSSKRKASAKVRTRTFSGCLTCRNRKVKCDLQKPACNNCKRLKLSCHGYETTIHWLPQWRPSSSEYASASYEDGRHQQHMRMRTELLSVGLRQEMSAGIVDKTVTADSACRVERILAELDVQAARIDSQEPPSWHRVQGPFGVFSAFQSKDVSSHPQQNDFDECLLPEVNPQTQSEARNNLTVWEDLDRFETEFHQPTFFSDGDLVIGTSDILFGSSQAANSAYQDTSILDSADSNSIDRLIQSFDPATHKNDFDDPLWQLRRSHQAVPAPILSQDLPEPKSPYLPSCAQYLLWHYANHTIPSLSGIPPDHAKTPWDQLHLPIALKAYAELNVLGDSSLPRVSLLYSLLSITCFQLKTLYKDGHRGHLIDHAGSGSSFAPDAWSMADWEAQAIKFRNIAQTGLRKCLQNVSTTAGDDFKYKEVLVAAVSLVCIRIVSGDTNDARSYILQCEEIIRNIGNPKDRDSRKAMALHRMFFYIQVMESASSGNCRSQHPKTLVSNISPEEDSALTAYIPDIGDPNPRDGQVIRASVSDLHLDSAEDENDAIYGIPESLLRLIARTTELIDEIESSPLTDSEIFIRSKEIERKTSSLENDICTWTVSNQRGVNPAMAIPLLTSATQADTENNADTTRQMLHCLSRAVHSAILVYFFRSVRKTHPVILQHYVERALHDLEIHTSLKFRFTPARLNVIVWPSFIAACEAVDKDLRRRAIACLRQAAWAGFCNWEAAETVAGEVWRRRDAGNVNASWQEVVRELQVNMVLT